MCTTDVCTAGSCTHDDNTVACDDGLFCTTLDTCSGGICAGQPLSCGDPLAACAELVCNEATNECEMIAHDILCQDEDPCTADLCAPADGCENRTLCGSDICRTAGFWSEHGGYEGKKSSAVNITQQLLDAAGPIEVCGETITTTSNLASPFLDGLGLTSSGPVHRSARLLQ